MGIEKPYEVETHRLGRPPGPHAPLDVGERMRALVVASDDGVRVAGRLLRVAPDELPERCARSLRERLTERLRERRPDADEHTWAWLVSTLHGMLRDGQTLDALTQRELIEAIDGL